MTAAREQLALDLPTPARVYECCGEPCGGLGEQRGAVFAHADACVNPNLGVWIDRATGWPLRRLHCVGADGTCPHGGAFPQRPGLADPHGGACCIVLHTGTPTGGGGPSC